MEMENKTKDIKFYSKQIIVIATFLGSPLAGTYMIRQNYLKLNKNKDGNIAFAIGIVFTLLIFVGLFSLPEATIDKIPKSMIPLINALITFFVVEKTQGDILNKHKENKNQFYSKWKAVGISLVAMLILIIGILGYVYLMPEEKGVELYNKEITVFSENEKVSLQIYERMSTMDDVELEKEINTIAIPAWKENIAIIKRTNNIEDLPIELIEQNKKLLRYSELRLKVFTLMQKALSEITTIYDDEIIKLNEEIDQLVDELNKI